MEREFVNLGSHKVDDELEMFPPLVILSGVEGSEGKEKFQYSLDVKA